MHTLQHSFVPEGFTAKASKTITHKFMSWCKAQEKNRLLWVAAIIMIHGCVLTPFTMFFIMSAGTSMLLLALATAAMAMALVVNLAAMPTKITLPVFFLSVIIDLVVITASIATGLSFTGL